MKLADFVEMIDWKVVNEQEVTFVAKVNLEDKTDFLNNEMIGRTKVSCNENSTDDIEFYESIDITPKTKLDFWGLETVDFTEDEKGRKLVEDINNEHYVVLN